MIRSTAQSLGRGFNTQGVRAYAFHRNALAMQRRVVLPNPRGLHVELVGRSQIEAKLACMARRAQIEAKLAATRTKDGQHPEEKKLDVGFSFRMTKLEDKLELLSREARAEANLTQAKLENIHITTRANDLRSSFLFLMLTLLIFISHVDTYADNDARWRDYERKRECEKREAS